MTHEEKIKHLKLLYAESNYFLYLALEKYSKLIAAGNYDDRSWLELEKVADNIFFQAMDFIANDTSLIHNTEAGNLMSACRTYRNQFERRVYDLSQKKIQLKKAVKG